MLDTLSGAVLALFVIANPLGAVPVYLSLRGANDLSRHRDDGWRAGLTVALFLAAFGVAGSAILAVFGVQIDALRASGGLIVTFMAFSMVRGEVPGTQHSQRDQDIAAETPDDNLSVYVPLSIPLIAGPGSIVTVITLAASPGIGPVYTLIAVAVLGLAVAISLALAKFWQRVLGDFGLRLLTRVFGLFVMAVGVQMVVLGTRALWNGG